MVHSLDEVERNLARYSPPGEGSTAPVRAAVALCLREAGTALEMLFIERAERHDDPWSGHLAFPGGRIDPGDSGPRAAAERETLEEVGLDLTAARYLGSLGTHRAERLPVVVSCFAYGVAPQTELRLNHEVADAFWVPLPDLLDPSRHAVVAFRFGGADWSHPAIRLLGSGRPLLWGITYRLVERFCEAVGAPLPAAADPASSPLAGSR
ncbi:NUDIX hydrolase [Deferrisoma camini]|uniref:NUDIX hydrolase n=1 Tax=Deferrisoma camini TaxID=1035120 RepID=UPI00046D963F|nr:CoA pyrophosphatase [Deferrisoma camini]